MDTGLLNAASEEQVMEIVLKVVSDLTGARGASLVPLDEWGQSLPAYTYGKLPPTILKAWTELLTSNPVRETCKACEKHQSLPGNVCPLVDGPFQESLGVYCFPLQRGERLMGMVNLYLPGKPPLSEELTGYLRGLLNEAALAVDSIRLRNRELSTLQQVQLLRAPRSDLQVLLGILLEGLQQVLQAEGVQLLAQASIDDQRSMIQVVQGNEELFNLAEAAALRARVLNSRRACLPDRDNPARDDRLIGVPLLLPGGKLLGTLLVASEASLDLDERKTAILRSVVDQAALLIENEREILSLEYRTVIQERARLAREIHDGLAQTLAFLKLQSAQMQIYLAQGNLTKLGQVLKQNYDALAEAYTDTRQAIDSLRLTPQQGMMTWLDQMLTDFENVSEIKVERSIRGPRQDLSPEIQAQLMRIVQEALNNIRKHAGAKQVVVSLREWNRDLILEVKDDGQGFSPEDVPGFSQYGLRGMRERAELIGADFQVISKPNQGTTVRLSLPVPTQESMV